MHLWQGGKEWTQNKMGNATQDLALLHRISCERPEAFWPAVLEQLNLDFVRPPDRWMGALALQGSERATSLCVFVHRTGLPRLSVLGRCRILQMTGSAEGARWLPGAQFNIAHSALYGNADRPAVVWATEEAPDTLHRLTLGQLRQRCTAAAAALRASDFQPGETWCPC